MSSEFEDAMKNPMWLLAAGIGVALIILAILFGLSYLLPAVGVAVSLAFTGAAAGFVMAPEVANFATYAIVVAGGAVAIQLTVRVVREAQKKPYSWTLPLLALVNGFLVLNCKEYWQGNKMVWSLMSVVLAALVVVAGALYARKSKLLKICALVIYFLVPLITLSAILISSPSSGVIDAFTTIPAKAWVLLGIMGILAVFLAFLARAAEKEGL